MKQYTAGELAELSGVSSRTIRYYDQKGILLPCDYTESGYRLYDENALIKMQQISMLKFAGFSLDEIHNVLLMDNRALPEILEDQRHLLLQQRDKITEVIHLLDRVLELDSPDTLTKLVECMKLIRSVNHSGRTYRFIQQHGSENLYPWEMEKLSLQSGMKILDLGCGYGLLWRFGWNRIPENTEIDLVDIYGKLLQQLQKFVDNQRSSLSPGSIFHFIEADAQKMKFKSGYDRIMMAYLWKYLTEPERVLKNAYDALKPGGFLCVVRGTGATMSDYDEIYKAFSGQSVLTQRLKTMQAEIQSQEAALNAVFPKVEKLVFKNELKFTHPLELYRFMMDSYTELSQAIQTQGIGFVNFLRNYVETNGTVTLRSKVLMYRCYKEA